MGLGLVFTICACFVWGAIFVVPEYLIDFSGVEVVLGRYLIYGIISCALFFRKGFKKARQIPKRAWVMALVFALFSNILYYLGIIGGIRFASAPLVVLVIGMAPIFIALYGNWHVREISYKSMVFPSAWIVFGLIMINVAEIDWTFTTNSLQQYLLGMFGVLVALIAWSWYAVHNARFLKRHPHIPSTDWSTLIGICTLFWAIGMGVLYGFILKKDLDFTKFTSWSNETARFLVGVILLGVICSWLGCYLWNRASIYLPSSLMGPFLIFESLFGLLFVYTFESRFPSVIEVIGVVSMLGGVLLSIRVFRKQQRRAL